MEEKARALIDTILYINLATVTPEGKPWNSPVYTAYDNEYNFYWASWVENQHSKNIVENGLVYAVVYDSQVPEGEGLGVYMEGQAKMLSDVDEIRSALELLYLRKKQPPNKRQPTEFLGKYPRRVFKFFPEKFWINDGGEIDGNFIDIKKEVKL